MINKMAQPSGTEHGNTHINVEMIVPTNAVHHSFSQTLDEKQARKNQLHKQSMIRGNSRKAASKIRFNFVTFFKQLMYHLLPPIFSHTSIRLIEGYQAATNQMMWDPINGPGGLRTIVIVNLLSTMVWIAIILHYYGMMLSELECSLLVTCYFSRAFFIALKYAFRSTANMERFHKETDPKKVNEILGENLLSSWMNPSYIQVVNLLQLASEHASFKTNVDWYTSQKNLKLTATFVGNERCKTVVEELLTIQEGSSTKGGCFGCGKNKQTVDRTLYTCKLQKQLFGETVYSAQKSGENCQSKLDKNDMKYLQVPVGTLLSGVFLNASKGSSKVSLLVIILAFILQLVFALCPIILRSITIQYYPEVAMHHNITVISKSNENEIVAGTGVALYMFGCLSNGAAIFIFVSCSVIDYRRRAVTLEKCRSLLRPSHTHNRSERTFQVSPPLIDLRINSNIFVTSLMQQTMLFFGKEYLLRLQFVISYALIGISILIIRTLIIIFGGSGSLVSSNIPSLPIYLDEGVVFALGCTLLISGIIMASVTFANFANLEPEYFAHAMYSQALGIHSDILTLYNDELNARSTLESIEFGENVFDEVDRQTGLLRRRSTISAENINWKNRAVEEEKLVKKEEKMEAVDETVHEVQQQQYKQLPMTAEENEKYITHLKRAVLRNERNRIKLQALSCAINDACELVRSTDTLYPIELLMMRADWKQMSAVVALLASAVAAIARAAG
jgi:hypothetical protein